MAVSPDFQAEDERGIRQFNEAAMAASRRKDAAAKAALWTEDAHFLPPGPDVIVGRAGVQRYWQSGFDPPRAPPVTGMVCPVT